RATIGNMSPEFGSTAAIFPIDEVTLSYLRLTGRSDAQVALVEAYAREQGMWHDPSGEGYAEPEFSEYLELDLSTVVPSIAGPKRPQDRIELTDAKESFGRTILDYVSPQEAAPFRDADAPAAGRRPHKPVPVTLADGTQTTVDHGSVVIASITSCTNTSNP